MRKLTYTIIMSLLAFKIQGQDKALNLEIGERLPVFQISKLLQSTGIVESISTAQFQNKLLIVDFWSTGCSSCIEALPEMMALNQKFKGKAVILPVTAETEYRIRDFLKKNKYTSNSKINTVVEDKILNVYFKHRGEPHEVWIFNGTIIGITDGEYVNDKNITDILSGLKPKWPVKYDFYTFNKEMPLFNVSNGQAGQGAPHSYAIIGKFREKLSSAAIGGEGIIKDTVNQTIRYFAINQSIFGVYIQNLLSAFPSQRLIKPSLLVTANCIVWRVADKSAYTYEKQFGYHQDWLRANAICFESLSKDVEQKKEEIFKNNLNKLNALLGLKVYWRKKYEKVYVLVKNLKKPAATKKYGAITNEYNLSGLVYSMNQVADNPYIFNTVKEDSSISILVESWSNIPSIRSQLQKQGYDLIEENREVDKLFFEENTDAL